MSQSAMNALMNRVAKGELSVDEAVRQAKGDANSQGLSPDMQIVNSVTGKGLGNRQKVYNYSLSHEGPSPNDRRAEDLWNAHQGSNNTIDLLIMKPHTRGHLASAISFARSVEKYTTFHYLPCRHVDTNDRKSMATVADFSNAFAGQEFKI